MSHLQLYLEAQNNDINNKGWHVSTSYTIKMEPKYRRQVLPSWADDIIWNQTMSNLIESRAQLSIIKFQLVLIGTKWPIETKFYSKTNIGMGTD